MLYDAAEVYSINSFWRFTEEDTNAAWLAAKLTVLPQSLKIIDLMFHVGFLFTAL